MSVASHPAVDWLLASDDPSVRYLTLVDVLGEPPDGQRATATRNEILDGPRVRKLLDGQRDNGFGVHMYHKWTGAHWRLVSLVELAVPPYEPRLRPAVDHVLDVFVREVDWNRVNGLARIHASCEGNAIAAACRLGLSADDRVKELVGRLLETQWPDGGWNCDQSPDASCSSVHESLATLWGLVEYTNATGDSDALLAVDRAAEFFLERRLFRSRTSGVVIDPEWLRLHYPPYWHYDVLQALLILSRADKLSDPRAADALDVIESKRDEQGRWRTDGFYWGTRSALEPSSLDDAPNVEVVDWGRDGPNEMITLNALRVLRAAGRL